MSFFAFPVKADFSNSAVVAKATLAKSAKPMSHFARTHYSLAQTRIATSLIHSDKPRARAGHHSSIPIVSEAN